MVPAKVLLLLAGAASSSEVAKKGMAESVLDIDAIFIMHHPHHDGSKHTHRPRLEGAFKKHKLAEKVHWVEVVDERETEMRHSPKQLKPVEEWRDQDHCKLGCVMAHWEVWHTIVERGQGLSLVIEEDVDIHDEFGKIIQMFLNRASADTDLLFLHNNPLEGEHLTADASQFVVEDPILQKFVGAYFVTQSGAAKLLKAFSKDAVVPLEQFLAAQHNKFEDDQVKKHYGEKGNLKVAATNIQLVDLHFQSGRYEALSVRAAQHREL